MAISFIEYHQSNTLPTPKLPKVAGGFEIVIPRVGWAPQMKDFFLQKTSKLCDNSP
jgi:hypothetical protein